MAVVLRSSNPGLRQQILEDFRQHQPGRDPKIVFVSGNFNVIHPGHQRLIQYAAECGDVLCVGINPDTVAGVMFAQELRLDGMRELSSVDYVFPIIGDLNALLADLKPDFVVKGKEHEGKENPEEPAVKQYGGKLVFGSGETKFSSIELLRQDFENIQYSTIRLPKDFLLRHKIDEEGLSEHVHSIAGMNVIVIGDTIVDEYITCEALGLSQEDPTIVVNPIHRKKFVGGAAIVAAHAAGLGANVEFFSVVGHDQNAVFVKEHLYRYGVHATLLEDSGRPTTHKARFRTKEKTLLRVNELRQQAVPMDLAVEILTQLAPLLKKCDLLVFSDFNYGALPTHLVREITRLAQKQGVTMVADSQSSSQIGDVSRFTDMKLLTPTEREARLGVSDFESGLVVLADKLIAKAAAENLFITLGSEGMLIRARSRQTKEFVTDRLPAFNFAPKDTAGAGDSLLITSSMLLAKGADVWTASYLGSLAAAIQVSRVGNTPLTSADLEVELRVGKTIPGVAS
jgi:rfaE bifunctional protein kinase chain/domain